MAWTLLAKGKKPLQLLRTGGSYGRLFLCLLPASHYHMKIHTPDIPPTWRGGRGGGDFHPSLCPIRAWGLV